MKVFLCNNSGLGDYIVLNGSTRYIASCKNVEHVDVLCIGNNNKFRHVSWMYRDNDKITVHPEPQANSFQQGRKKIRRWASRFPHSEKRVFLWTTRDFQLKFPVFGLDSKTQCWPELFYKAHKSPFSARHEHFYIERDKDRELRLFDKLYLPSKYAFCCDTSTKGRHRINLSGVKIPIVRPTPSDGDLIFDWMTVIERASEVHTVDTSWLHLIKSMRLNQPKFYYNCRPFLLRNIHVSSYINDEYDNGWNIID